VGKFLKVSLTGMGRKALQFGFLILGLCVLCLAKPKILSFEILDHFPHTVTSFTQGLVFYQGKIYESTGLYSQSQIRVLNPKGGQVLDFTVLDPKFFGEGLTSDGNFLYQLTWREEIVLVYQINPLRLLKQIQLKGEGWGLAYNFAKREFYHSDGSATIYIRNSDFKLKSSRTISLNGKPLQKLNELEWDGTSLWSNVWFCDSLFRLNLQTGKVTGIVNLTSLRSLQPNPEAVLNGIAHFDTKVFFITGKLWDRIYKIRIK